MRNWYQELLAAHEQNNYELLNSLFDQVRREAPNDSGYFHAMGIIFADQGEVALPMECFIRALLSNAASAPQLISKAYELISHYHSIYPHQNMPQTRFTPSITPPHDLSDQPIWQQTAYASAIAGHEEEVLTLLEEQLRNHPDDPDTYIFMSKIFIMRHFFKEAQVSINEALRLHPFHIEALLVKGMLLQEMNQYTDALASFLMVTLLDVTNIQAWEGQAEAIFQGEYDLSLALFAYEQAIQLQPNRASSSAGKAKVLRALGREAEAEQILLLHSEKLKQNNTVIIEAWYRRIFSNTPHHCYSCGVEATYQTDHYTDLEFSMGLAVKQTAASSKDMMATARFVHDAARARAVDEQSQGIRKQYATTFWCKNCMSDLINKQMGQAGPGEAFILSGSNIEPEDKPLSAVLFRYMRSLEINRLLFMYEKTLEGFLLALDQSPDHTLDFTRDNNEKHNIQQGSSSKIQQKHRYKKKKKGRFRR